MKIAYLLQPDNTRLAQNAGTMTHIPFAVEVQVTEPPTVEALHAWIVQGGFSLNDPKRTYTYRAPGQLDPADVLLRDLHAARYPWPRRVQWVALQPDVGESDLLRWLFDQLVAGGDPGPRCTIVELQVPRG